jgi:phage terminase large subunit GpA
LVDLTDHCLRAVDLPTWRHTPTSSAHRGYRLNALSPLHNAGWGELAVEFLRGQERQRCAEGFPNTVLGQARRREDDEIGEAALAKREPFSLDVLPPEVLVICAGVDVQVDRLEVSLVRTARRPLSAAARRRGSSGYRASGPKRWTRSCTPQRRRLGSP